MKVRALHTKAFTLRSNEELIAKIKKEGKLINAGAWPYGSSVQLNDMFFLLGGRGSIDNVLTTVPTGCFKSNLVTVKITSHATLTKKYTIIAVCEANYAARLGQNKQAWGTMFSRPSNVVWFSDIISKLWDGENKIQDDILEYAGLT
jgi:hypothetical protein